MTPEHSTHERTMGDPRPRPGGAAPRRTLPARLRPRPESRIEPLSRRARGSGAVRSDRRRLSPPPRRESGPGADLAESGGHRFPRHRRTGGGSGAGMTPENPTHERMTGDPRPHPGNAAPRRPLPARPRPRPNSGIEPLSPRTRGGGAAERSDHRRLPCPPAREPRPGAERPESGGHRLPRHRRTGGGFGAGMTGDHRTPDRMTGDLGPRPGVAERGRTLPARPRWRREGGIVPSRRGRGGTVAGRSDRGRIPPPPARQPVSGGERSESRHHRLPRHRRTGGAPGAGMTPENPTHERMTGDPVPRPGGGTAGSIR